MCHRFNSGRSLGNPSPQEASALGVAAQKAAADRFAANTLPLIADIQGNGATSLRAVADALNARGIQTARGGSWHPSSVRNVMGRAG
jgi:hypothetical protein